MSFNISAQKKASVASKQEKYLVLSMQVSHHAYCNQWLNKRAQIFTKSISVSILPLMLFYIVTFSSGDLRQ
jgi:hypothetical protein